MKNLILALLSMITTSCETKTGDTLTDQEKEIIRSALLPFMKSIIRHAVLLHTAVLISLHIGYTQPVWVSQTSGTTSGLFGVWFTDANTGTVVGGIPNNCILRTTDAGETWSPQSYDEVGGYLSGVCFSDSMNGWVTGQYGTILHTTNGGITWTPQLSGTIVDLNIAFCIDSNTAWALCGYGTIVHTTNGGDTWDSLTSGTMINLWGISFINADTGTVVGGYCSCTLGEDLGTIILRTTDGGDTWTSQTHGTTNNLYGVFFTDANTGTAVGSGGTILRTTNGGTTWTPQLSGTTNDLWDVFFTSHDTGTVVGGNCDGFGGTILRTTNGGTTWTNQTIPTQVVLWKVFFTDANTGTAVGNMGTILRTTTGGVSWIEENLRDEIPRHLSLSQNYPNPFKLSTTIKFHIPDNNKVTLKVYTVDGKEVATLVNEELRPGSYEVTWDAGGFPEGVYFYKLKASSYAESRKLVLE